jgi:hypothetical protein
MKKGCSWEFPGDDMGFAAKEFGKSIRFRRRIETLKILIAVPLIAGLIALIVSVMYDMAVGK